MADDDKTLAQVAAAFEAAATRCERCDAEWDEHHIVGDDYAEKIRALTPADAYLAGAASVVAPLYQHIKRGSTYRRVGHAVLQTATPLGDMEPLIVYRGEDGRLWARPVNEFYDGRFRMLGSDPKPARQSDAGQREIAPSQPGEASASSAPARGHHPFADLLLAAEALVEFHNLPPLAKRPDVFQMRMASLDRAVAAALASTGEAE